MFWAPPKYKPRTVEFNPDTTTHDVFVKLFSSILAAVLGVNSDSDPDPSSYKKKPKRHSKAQRSTTPRKSVSHAPYPKWKYIDFIWAAASIRVQKTTAISSIASDSEADSQEDHTCYRDDNGCCVRSS